MPVRRAVVRDGDSRIDVPTALSTWALAWVVGNVLSAVVLALSGHAGEDTDEIPIWVLFLGTVIWLATFPVTLST